MGIIVTLSVQDGIVIGADSRLSLQEKAVQGDKEYITNIIATDTLQKIYYVENKENDLRVLFGWQGPLQEGKCYFPNAWAEWREILANERCQDSIELLDMMREFFRSKLGDLLFKTSKVEVYVAGFLRGERFVYSLRFSEKKHETLFAEENPFLLSWKGDGDIIFRLIYPLFHKQNSGNYEPVAYFPVNLSFFTLNDAMEFVSFLLTTTKNMLGWQHRFNTVGGEAQLWALPQNGDVIFKTFKL